MPLFFSEFFKPFRAAEHELHKVVNFVGDGIDRAFIHPRNLPHISLQTIGDIAIKAAVGIEVIGAATGQPEIIAAGAGLGIVGNVVSGIGGALDKSKAGKKGEALADLGGVVAGLASLNRLEEQQNIKLANIGAVIGQVGGFIQQVEEGLQTTNVLLEEDVELEQQELQQGSHLLTIEAEELKFQKDNNDMFKQFLDEKHGFNEGFKHQQVVLDNELQALRREDLKQEE